MASEAIVSALAALGGAVVGAGASVLNASRTAARERARQLSLDRRRYLEPLRLAALDLGVLLMHIDEALAAPATEQAGAAATDKPRLHHLRRPAFSPDRRKHETQTLKTAFGKLKKDRGPQGEFMAWANGEGTFAVATLYRTVVYCWAAQRIKQDLPILESRTGGDGQLLELLDEVRQALGDRWGIWEAIQDSIGSHAALPDGRVISYPEFCGQLSDRNDYIWFSRLIDFYNDVCNGEKAPTRHHPVIRRGASGLVRFSPMPSDHVIVTSTTDNEDAARALAAGVIEAKLGACAQIVGPITSVYRWEGEAQTEQEWRVEIKTAADRVAALTEHIKTNHSYDVPEIIVTPIAGGSAEYLSWLVDETRG